MTFPHSQNLISTIIKFLRSPHRGIYIYIYIYIYKNLTKLLILNILTPIAGRCVAKNVPVFTDMFMVISLSILFLDTK